MKIGFIGLGIMGAPMAGHLLAAGHEMFVRTRSKVPEGLQAGDAVRHRPRTLPAPRMSSSSCCRTRPTWSWCCSARTAWPRAFPRERPSST